MPDDTPETPTEDAATSAEGTDSTGGGPEIRSDRREDLHDLPEESTWSVTERWRPSIPTVAFLLSLLALGAFYWHVDNSTGPMWGGWTVSQMDWLTLLAAAVAISFVGVPAVVRRERTMTMVRRYPKTPGALAALLTVVVFVLVGTFGPVFMGPPEFEFSRASQPPYGVTSPMRYTGLCVGPVVEGGFRGLCKGTLQYPLGTTRGGEPIHVWLVYGTRVALQFTLIAVAFQAPIAIAVGATSAYLGGTVESVAMTYVEVQQSVPTVIIYFISVAVFGPTLFALALIYGLFDWSNLARSVYSAAESEAEEGYILAAENAGGDWPHVVRKHIVPNVSNTVVTSLTVMVPKLIMIEALFGFLKLSGDKSYSFGMLIQRGLWFYKGGVMGGARQFESLWWIPVLPTVAIFLTVFAFSVFGDGLQTAVDPRYEQ